jgi:hypothetical protein
MEKLTAQEEEAMLVLWQAAPCFVKDILAKYDDPKPPYTTLARLIILSVSSSHIRRGTSERKRRILPPPGSTMLF